MRRVLLLLLGAALVTGCMFEEGDLPESVDESFPTAMEEEPLMPSGQAGEAESLTKLNAHKYPRLVDGEPVGSLPTASGPAPGKSSVSVFDGPKGPSGLQVQPEGPGSLVAGVGCDGLEDVVKARVIEAMEDAVDRQKENFMWYQCDWYYWDYDCDGLTNGTEGGGSPPPPPETSDSAGEYSETNTQVAGVDEADFIKNDGSHIYVVANGRLQILDAWPPQTATKIADVEVEGTPKKLYVYGDRAVVYSSGEPLPPMAPMPYYGYYGSYNSGQECTYGYDCDFSGDGNELFVLTYDITDRSSPHLIRRTEYKGSYLNSRRIDGSVYTVATFPTTAIPGMELEPQGLLPELNYGSEWWDFCENWEMTPETELAFEQLKEYNKGLILQADLQDLLPEVHDTLYVGGQAVEVQVKVPSCEDFLISPTESAPGFLALAGVDMVSQKPVNFSLIVGKPGAVYGSQNSLYVAVRQYKNTSPNWPEEDEEINEMTVLHKFWLNKNNASGWYAASGAVKGRILNQFSMDEWEGHLRIATTHGKVPNPAVHSTISVLRQEGTSLVVTGQIDDIAPTEDIRSARFNGPTGYIVTFKKTDPLFVINLVDPIKPFIEGELKIPGYSTYMHILDDEHILSIGYDADDQGSFAYFQGIMLQVFNVADLANPFLLHKEVIGTRGSTSDAATNHLAFNFFKPKDWLAIPMVVCEDSGGGGSYGDEMTFSGLMVYDVTVADGFDYLGGVPHAVADGENYKCYNWWTNSNSKVKRSIFMDDYVYSVAMDEVKIAHIDALDSPITAVPIL